MRLLNSIDMQKRGQVTTVPKDIRKININNKYMLYDCNSMALWEVTKEQFDTLDTSSIAQDWCYFMKDSLEEYKEKGYLCLNVTDECPLACVYCFVREHYKDITSASRMLYEDAIQALDYYQPKWREQGCKLGFFGGEPLVNWELIYKVVEYTQANCSNKELCGYHVTTNGVLMTEEIADYTVSKNFSFIVSLDGEEDDHNNSRPYRAIIGNSFKDTLRCLEFLKEKFTKYKKYNNVTLRSTFGKEGCNLVQRLKFLNSLMYKGYANHVSIEPATVGESCSYSSFEKVTKDEIKLQFEEQYINAAKWFITEIKEGRTPSLHHFEMPLQRLFDRDLAVTECGAGKGYVSVGKDGDVCACHRRHESSIGNIYKGINQIELEKWLPNTLYHRIGCSQCWQRYICGGGCRCNSALLNKNLATPYWVECLFKELQLNSVLYMFTELTKDELRIYSKYNKLANPNKKKIISDQPQKTEPQQAPSCEGKSKKPICGLKYCQGVNCPFSKCGRHTKEEILAVTSKLIKENL